MNLYSFYFYKLIGKLNAFFAPSGVPLEHSTSDQFHYRREEFSSRVKSKIVNILVKDVFCLYLFEILSPKKGIRPDAKGIRLLYVGG